MGRVWGGGLKEVYLGGSGEWNGKGESNIILF